MTLENLRFFEKMKFMYLRRNLKGVMLAVPVFMTGCGNPKGEIADSGEEPTNSAAETHKARYTEEGALIRPDNWREWIFVGMPGVD